MPYFCLVGEVGVAGAELVLDVGVVLRALIGILDQQPDRRARRHLLARAGMRHDSRQDPDRVRLLPLRRKPRLAGTAAIEVALDFLCRERQQRRATVDHAADRQPVALAKGRDTEQMTEGVVGHW